MALFLQDLINSILNIQYGICVSVSKNNCHN